MLHVDIVAPSGNVFRGQATRFRAPGENGSFEVLTGHAPMVAVLGVGSVYVTSANGERVQFATSGGFVEVFNNRVTLLAESAEPASEIDVERAQAAEERAREALANATSEERAEAEKALERARNRVRVSMGSVGAR
ncbi:MAG: ATP synthase F1 subunit epsilon, partial [Bacteroidota bacterium]